MSELGLPSGWDNTATKTQHGYRIESGGYDFDVFPYITGGNSLESGYDDVWGGSFRFRVVVVSAVTGSDKFKLVTEIMKLSGKTLGEGDNTIKIPEKSDPVTSTAVIDSVSVEQEGESPDVWIMVFKIQKVKYKQWKTTPKPKPIGPSTIHDPYPWEETPKMNVTFGSETYSVGMGYFCGAKTPNEISDLIEANKDGLAGMYVGTGFPFEVMVNSANDPFKSPPPTKVGVTNFEVSASFQGSTSLNSLISEAQSARENINATSFNIAPASGATSFTVRKGTAMLTGFVITPAQFKDTRDWLPKQYHPFSKSYTDLGWEGGSAIAINKWNRVLTATEMVSYTNLKLTFTVKEVGWGTAIVNKGFRSLKSGVIGQNKDKDGSKSSQERLLDGDGVVIPEGTKTEDIACFRLYCPFGSNDSLKNVLDTLF